VLVAACGGRASTALSSPPADVEGGGEDDGSAASEAAADGGGAGGDATVDGNMAAPYADADAAGDSMLDATDAGAAGDSTLDATDASEAGDGPGASSDAPAADVATDAVVDGGQCPAIVEGDAGVASVTTSTGNLTSPCTIALPGSVTQVAYEPTQGIAYGIDPTNSVLSAIELSTGTVTSRPTPAVPNALCVSASRSRVFVVDTGSSFVDEYDLADLSLVRRIPWPSPSYDTPDLASYLIYCGAERLYVVDSSWAPGLWTIENLDGCPSAVDHTAAVSGVGGLVLSADESELYYWYQYGRVAGEAGSAVYRVTTSDWATVDQTTIGYQQGFYRDPQDTPILWDVTRSYILAKNRIFDANDLSTVIYTFTSPSDATSSMDYQNAYAFDPQSGWLTTRHNAFSLDTFASQATVTESAALQYFVSADGNLQALTASPSQIVCQVVP
jgi:hypothetical protein